MFRQLSTFALVVCLVTAISGCGVKPTKGGTPGVLRAGGELIGEIQINVFAVEATGTRLIGFGVTGDQGQFELFTNGAQGPLLLTPGDYCFTVETAGAPVFFPQEYAAPATSPLKVRWSESDKALQLETPLSATPPS